ncbi:hypothetical protein ACFXPV_33430 [Streptomyces sp. NPDC059118]|uniref:hypothetical protein n=1 Tax=unclassified Streptomyces TaxID=2593676 RepID=UPI0036BEDE82
MHAPIWRLEEQYLTKQATTPTSPPRALIENRLADVRAATAHFDQTSLTKECA